MYFLLVIMLVKTIIISGISKSGLLTLHKFIESSPNVILTNKVKQIVFNEYKSIAYKFSNDFQRFHKYKCSHVSKYDLHQGALIGLWNAVGKYNTTYPFYPYARTYIFGELYKTLTINYPIRKQSATFRRKHKILQPLSFDNVGLYDTYNYNQYPVKTTESFNIASYYPFWEIIDTLDENTKQIFFYMFNRFFDKIRSNKEVAQLSGYSKETVRLKILYVLNKLTNGL